jgi:hypothetical protein
VTINAKPAALPPSPPTTTTTTTAAVAPVGATLTSLELQIENVDRDMIDSMTANERARAACLNLIRNLNGIGGVAKLVYGCHDMAQDVSNFEAELAALDGEELNLRDDNALLRRELEKAVLCMETLLLDAEPPLMVAAAAAAASRSREASVAQAVAMTASSSSSSVPAAARNPSVAGDSGGGLHRSI